MPNPPPKGPNDDHRRKVKELKDLLSERGLKVSGLKVPGFGLVTVSLVIDGDLLVKKQGMKYYLVTIIIS